MITIYRKTANDKKLIKKRRPAPKHWIDVVAPTAKEIEFLEKRFNIPEDVIIDILDENELPRVEKENGMTIIIFRIPHRTESRFGATFVTYPLGVILTGSTLITICSIKNEIIRDFINGKVKTFYTSKRVRFLLQLFNRTSYYFTIYLRYIEHVIERIKETLPISSGNEGILRLLELQKSLQYFNIATVANNSVMQRIVSGRLLPLYKGDQDLLEDIIIDNRQTIQMISLYSNLLTNFMNGYSSIISNNLNNVMKFLTAITIILAIPTIIASYYGMNVELPFQHASNAFWITILLSMLISVFTAVILSIRRLL